MGTIKKLRVNCFKYLCCLVLAGCILQAGAALGQAADKAQHPRGFISLQEQKNIRLRVTNGAFSQKLALLEQQPDLFLSAQIPANAADAYRLEKWLSRCAFLYALTAKKDYAGKAAQIAGLILKDSAHYLNPMVKGLTRAAMLRAMATAYDLCYEGWSEPLRNAVARSLLHTAFSMQSTMGFEANYALESNWMGVRYGAVLYALMVTDYKGRKSGRFTEADMLEWDVRERLRDHIRANMNPNGWSGESLGYHYYSWSFIAPALIAYEHRVLGKGKALEAMAPSCLQAVATHATVVAYIRGMDAYTAVKPDFSDDNIGVRPEFLLQALRLYPQSQQPYIKWLVERIGLPNSEEALFYALAWMQDSVASKNPAQAGWRQAVEPTQGAIAFRNRFQDSTDIIAAFTTTAKRIRAHQGGDNLSFRIIGLDNIWVVGAGRTGLKAGQPTLFPADTVSLSESFAKGAIGQLIHYGLDSNGGGFAAGRGSCTGVADHTRYFRADFDSGTGASAVFIVYDQSLNGRTWRLTTPEWNEVTPTENGFVLTAPNGATLQASLLRSKKPVRVRTSLVNYNGTTTQNASGIPYKGKQYAHIKAVDLPVDGTATVVITLQAPGKAAPTVRVSEGDSIQVGSKKYVVNER